MKQKTVLGVTLSKLIGLLVFLLILWILNNVQLNNSVALQIVGFLNNNFEMIIIMSILFYFGELFGIFKFPFNIPSPLFNALGGFFLVSFLFQMFFNIGQVTSKGILQKFIFLSPFVAILVFFIVITVGYFRITLRFLTIKKKDNNPERHNKKKGRKTKDKNDKKIQNIKWDDIGHELKLAAYNLAKTIKESLEFKHKKKK